MTHYDWPGNIRQLINAIERAKILADDSVIRLENLPPEMTPEEPCEWGNEPMLAGIEGDLAAINRACVIHTLRQQDGNKKESAKVLGVSRRTLYRLLDKYNIQPQDFRRPTVAAL